MMTTDQIITAFSVLIAAGSLLILAVKGRFDTKRGDREVALAEKAQANDDAETTISLLREQADILRTHRDDREAEIKEEKKDWRERERRMEERYEKRLADLEERVKNSEAAYTALVLTVTTMGFCAKAHACPNHDAGDRRQATGGTI